MKKTNLRSFGTYIVYIISVVLLIALLSAWGFYSFEKGHNDKVLHFGDSLWWTIVTMTTIGYGDIFPVTVGGRIVAVLLMFVGIGTLGVSTAAIAAYFVKSDQLELLRIFRIENHVVICGLGEKGLLLARAFQKRGDSVIVVEKEEFNPLIESARDLGVTVLVGDGTDPDMLLKARVPVAKTLIAVCGDDGTNAEVATHARTLISNRTGTPLTCSAHIVNPELWYLLRHWELSTVGAFRMQFFNVFDLGARALLAEHPPFSESHTRHHLLIIGSGKMAQNLVYQAVREWRDNHANSGKFKITIADQIRIADLENLSFPGVESVCEIERIAIDISSTQFQRARFLYDTDNRLSVTVVYVCLENDGLALSAALALLHRIRDVNVPIVVRMTQNVGLATLLRSSQSSARGFDRIHAVGILEKICQPDLVLGGSNETLARTIHHQYVQEQRRAGVTEGPALVPWSDLSEDLKESNRRQADQIGLKLRKIGCDIAPLSEGDTGTFPFTEDEVAMIAQMEHDRWVAERKAQGWTFGPRDTARKTNPNLLPWEKLPEDSRTLNENTVREMPATLARAGFQIYRVR